MLKRYYFMKKQFVIPFFLLCSVLFLFVACAKKQTSAPNKEVSSGKQNTSPTAPQPIRNHNGQPAPPVRPMPPPPPGGSQPPPSAPPTIMPPPPSNPPAGVQPPTGAPPKSNKTADDCTDPARKTPNVMCASVFQPVCGCDKRTYSNECEARKNGVLKWTRGECK